MKAAGTPGSGEPVARPNQNNKAEPIGPVVTLTRRQTPVIEQLRKGKWWRHRGRRP